jgi:hypothetical protein
VTLAGSPAFADWARVTDIPAGDVFSVRTVGDTIVAGVDTTVYVSTNAGTSWALRGDSIFAATLGAGVYVRNLSGATWHPFGTELEPNQASNVNDVEVGNNRLIASGGANGQVFYNDPGNAWVLSAGSPITFSSVTGQEPWSRTFLPIPALSWSTLSTRGSQVFGAFSTFIDVTIMDSGDN